MLDSLRIPPVLQSSSLKLRRAFMPPMSDSQTQQSKLNKRLDSLVIEEPSLSHRQVLSTAGVRQKPPSHHLERHHRKLTAIHYAHILTRQSLQLAAGRL
jgi:hypothetical protein